MAASVATDRFSLPLPEGWTDRTAVTITGPEQAGVTPNVVVTREQLCDNIGLGAFSDGWVARLGDQVPVQQVAPVEHVRIDGRRAHLRIVSWSAAGLEITQMVGLVVDGTDAYAVVGTASTDAFPSLADALRAAICGLRFTSTAVADPDAD